MGNNVTRRKVKTPPVLKLNYQVQPKSDVDFLKTFDGTGRTPREVQKDFLEWLAANWHKAQVFACKAPVGAGKSAIARAIQLATKAHVITPSNILINQYIDTYKSANFLKGKDHYRCSSGLSCKDWTSVLEQPACPSCPYVACRDKAIQGAPTFFNPMSKYYLNSNSDVVVVDEAHQLASMMLLLCTKRFRKSMYNFPKECENEIFLVEWMKTQLNKLTKLAGLYLETGENEKAIEIATETEALRLTLRGLEEDTQNYAIWFDKGTYKGKAETFLNVSPVRPPKFLVKKLLSSTKIVLLSGTLFPADIADLSAGGRVIDIDLPSPIPKQRRPIFYRPSGFKMNFNTDPKMIAAAIEDILDRKPGNAIIHVSYALSKKLLPHFTRPVISNTSADKDEKLKFFLNNGGVFLAAGCAEGLDLKDDFCRVNIIPCLVWPNLMDPVVKKRKALEDGESWYALETLKTLIQQAGRSTRHENDYSETFVLDGNFGWLVSKYKQHLPKSFLEQIVWHK